MPISIEGKRPSFEFTSAEHQQVKDFLDKCHLLQYYATFIDEGFESLQAVSICSFAFFWKHFCWLHFARPILDVRDQVLFAHCLSPGFGNYRGGSDRFERKKRPPTSNVFGSLSD